MASRKFNFVNNEYYHLYNRGVDKRDITIDKFDSDRFVQSLDVFNDIALSGSIYEFSRDTEVLKKERPLVEVLAYCLNPNHFHLLVRQKETDGVSKFLHRLTGGYSWYFNNKYKRKGALFQGPFKARHVDDNDYLLHLSAYINYNYVVHRISGETKKRVRTSLQEYQGEAPRVCHTKFILGQFDSPKAYVNFCQESLELMLRTKDEANEAELYHE